MTSEALVRPVPHGRALRSTLPSVLAHMLFAVGLMVFLWHEAPGYAGVFGDLGVVTPAPTMLVLAVADIIRSSPGALVLLMLAGLGMDGVVHYVLRRWAPRVWSRLWGWVIAVVLVGCIAGVYLALHVPLAQVVRNASL